MTIQEAQAELIRLYTARTDYLCGESIARVNGPAAQVELQRQEAAVHQFREARITELECFIGRGGTPAKIRPIYVVCG